MALCNVSTQLSVNKYFKNEWMNDPVETKHIHWMGCFIIAAEKKTTTAWESDPLAGPLSLTIQYIEEEKTKVNLPCWHFPSTGCIHQFLKDTAIKLLTRHRLPREPGRDGRGRDGVGTGGSKHSYVTAVGNQWALLPTGFLFEQAWSNLLWKKIQIRSMLFLGTERCKCRGLAVGEREEKRLINMDQKKKNVGSQKRCCILATMI